MLSLTKEALAHHNQLQNNPIPRVKVRAMSGDQIGWYSMGEKPETVLTFPGAFTVGEIVRYQQYEKWVRKAKEGDDRNEILTRTLPSGEKIEFVQVGDIKAVIINVGDIGWLAGHEQKIGTLDQKDIFGVATEAEIPFERASADGKPIDLNDIQPVSIASSVFSDWVSSHLDVSNHFETSDLYCMQPESSSASLASNEWFPEESDQDTKMGR